MSDNKIIKIATSVLIGLVVVPRVIGVTVNTVGLLVVGVSNINNNIKYKKKIKNGLKDGSIVEIDGKFYEVTID